MNIPRSLEKLRKKGLTEKGQTALAEGAMAETIEDELMTLEEVSKFCKVSRRSVERWVKGMQIPFIPMGDGERQIKRVLKSELLAWLRKRSVKPARVL